MKINEELQSYGSVKNSIKAIVSKMFGKTLDDRDLSAISNSMSLSSMIELGDAYEAGDEEHVASLLNLDQYLSEYAMAGRTNVQSAATKREADIEDTTEVETDTAEKDEKAVGASAPGYAKSLEKDKAREEREAELDAIKQNAGVK